MSKDDERREMTRYLDVPDWLFDAINKRAQALPFALEVDPFRSPKKENLLDLTWELFCGGTVTRDILEAHIEQAAEAVIRRRKAAILERAEEMEADAAKLREVAA